MLELLHGPSTVPSVVNTPDVVLVNDVPGGVLTVQVMEVPVTGGVTLVDSVTEAVWVASTHPVTVAVGTAIVGHVQPFSVTIVEACCGGQLGGMVTVRVTTAPAEVVPDEKACEMLGDELVVEKPSVKVHVNVAPAVLPTTVAAKSTEQGLLAEIKPESAVSCGQQGGTVKLADPWLMAHVRPLNVATTPTVKVPPVAGNIMGPVFPVLKSTHALSCELTGRLAVVRV